MVTSARTSATRADAAGAAGAAALPSGVIGPAGLGLLPWLRPMLEPALQHAGSHHALLIDAPRGCGQFELAIALAQSWLCEGGPTPRAGTRAFEPACGACAACRLVAAQTHPDLLVLLPEADRESLGWLPGEAGEASSGADGGATGDAGSSAASTRRKPSREIKVEAVRQAVAFATVTRARGRGKVVVVHPADRMNAISANTLLKTLEEPVGDTRFVLACGAADRLLPTVRSRCQRVPLPLPPGGVAVEWLESKGVADADVMLAAAGGRPQEALAMAADGIDAAAWRALPGWVHAGQAPAMLDWPLPRAVEALLMLCHDLQRVARGVAPRSFEVARLPPGAGPVALDRWARDLLAVAAYAEHPVNGALTVEALVEAGRQTWLAPVH